MEEKYINFYKKFILQTKTLNDCGVSLNSELELTKSITLYFNVSFQDHGILISHLIHHSQGGFQYDRFNFSKLREKEDCTIQKWIVL